MSLVTIFLSFHIRRLLIREKYPESDQTVDHPDSGKVELEIYFHWNVTCHDISMFSTNIGDKRGSRSECHVQDSTTYSTE